jgi:four helix bundle protein
MSVKSYRELVCWQLSVQLRDELIAITARPAFSRNFKLCEQVGDSTRSAASNIAEGFGRSDREFRRYLEIAIGSLKETENHLDEALAREYRPPSNTDTFAALPSARIWPLYASHSTCGALRSRRNHDLALARPRVPIRPDQTRPDPTRPDLIRPDQT